MGTFLIFVFGDTLVPRLAWPYYVSQSVVVESYKAVEFTPPRPCSISQFLYCVGSDIPNVSKECSVIVWRKAGNMPGDVLISHSINVGVAEAGKLHWKVYELSPPLHIVGTFWVGLWESPSLPTTVFDGVPSFQASYSLNGTGWDSVGVDYFYGVVVKYILPQIHIDPEALSFRIHAETNPIDTTILTVSNRSDLYNLSVDSISWNKPWVISVSPNLFELVPTDSKKVEVVCGNARANGTYFDTLCIFSSDLNYSPSQVTLTLIATGYGTEEIETLRTEGLRIWPNPFTKTANVKFMNLNIKDCRFQIYDIVGRLVEEVSATNEMKVGKHLSSGIYFVKVKGYKPVKIIKIEKVK